MSGVSGCNPMILWCNNTLRTMKRWNVSYRIIEFKPQTQANYILYLSHNDNVEPHFKYAPIPNSQAKITPEIYTKSMLIQQCFGEWILVTLAMRFWQQHWKSWNAPISVEFAGCCPRKRWWGALPALTKWKAYIMFVCFSLSSLQISEVPRCSIVARSTWFSWWRPQKVTKYHKLWNPCDVPQMGEYWA